MKLSIKKFFEVFLESSWAYSRPILTFDTRQNWFALVLSIIIANAVGAVLTIVFPFAFVLVNVGSFLGTVICVLPRHSSPQRSAIDGILMIFLGASLGILLQSSSIFIILLFVLGLYFSGIVRNFSIGLYIRCLFGTISLLAGAQLKGNLSIGQTFEGLVAIILGMSILCLFYCLYSKPQNNEARKLVADLYEQLYLLAQGKPARYVHFRIKVRESVETMPWVNHQKTPWIYPLVSQADAIAGSLDSTNAAENLPALKAIQLFLKGEQLTLPLQEFASANTEIKSAILLIQNEQSFKKISFKSFLPTKEGLAEAKEILHSYKGSSARFAIRLALTGLVCHFCSLILNYMYPLPLANHEFWVVISGCLMVMPGYHGTLGKITSRTIGSILGGCLGIFLSQLIANLTNLNPLWPMLLSCLLVILYETVRKLSQAFLMLSVTTWLTFTLGGSSAGYTRVFDVIIGALIAFVMFFIFPTWHSQVLRKNINSWSKTISSILLALINEETTLPSDAWVLAYRVQRRVNYSIQEIVLESPIYSNDASAENLMQQKQLNDQLLEMQTAMEELLLELMKTQHYLKKLTPVRPDTLNTELFNYSQQILSLTNPKNNRLINQSKQSIYFPQIEQSLVILKNSTANFFLANIK
ncbi:FUSC family protein [Enterococcus faecalis]|uniref:FUSC family protein n=1 Tax=Enterococcus faecalis TaxID=1351 RepID=UPI000CF1CCD2|nr:FUSC family protein [Enterococcus faecalis]PQG08837.1 FUSC family protein [Enterococcus faecalis]